jgi:hypothetical protein
MNANNGGNTRIEGMSTAEDPSNSSMQHNSMNAKKGMYVSHSRNADNIFYTRSRKDVKNSRTPATAESH